MYEGAGRSQNPKNSSFGKIGPLDITSGWENEVMRRVERVSYGKGTGYLPVLANKWVVKAERGARMGTYLVMDAPSYGGLTALRQGKSRRTKLFETSMDVKSVFLFWFGDSETGYSISARPNTI